MLGLVRSPTKTTSNNLLTWANSPWLVEREDKEGQIYNARIKKAKSTMRSTVAAMRIQNIYAQNQ